MIKKIRMISKTARYTKREWRAKVIERSNGFEVRFYRGAINHTCLRETRFLIKKEDVIELLNSKIQKGKSLGYKEFEGWIG